VRNCTASGNESGIGLGSGSVIGCEANDNTPGSGISVLSTGVVQQCHARDNGEDGILVGSSVRVTECSAAQNGDDGIQVAALSSVTGCAVAGNGQTSADGAGIHNPSGQSRIDSNVVSLNPIGISVGGSGGALIVRNTLLSNTMDFDVSSGHVIGTLIDMNAIDGVFTSDAPWANFVR
jgi:parallel beta-helix repeat protein